MVKKMGATTWPSSIRIYNIMGCVIKGLYCMKTWWGTHWTHLNETLLMSIDIICRLINSKYSNMNTLYVWSTVTVFVLFLHFALNFQCFVVIKITVQSDSQKESGIIWASEGKKPVFGVCEQQRRRPACASTQPDQRLCYSLFWNI